METAWSILAAVMVYVSYLTNSNRALPWIGLVLACMPFLWRLLARRTLIRRTPFDIPIALMTLGAMVGLCVSPVRSMSLGALQCMLAIIISYYVLTSCERAGILMRFLILALPVALVIVLILLLAGVPDVFNRPDFDTGSRDTNHGLALQLSLAGILLFGVAMFARSNWARIAAVIAFLSSSVVVILMTSDSFRSLFKGYSISNRMDLWQGTVTLLRDHPIAGLGLGCWARTYYGTMDLWNDLGFIERTHPHNAYLELYANTGLLGVLALVFTLLVGARLSLDIVRSPRSRRWYGLGFGVVLACILTMVVAIVESAPVGQPHVAAATYYYVVCPIPIALMALMVVAHRLITQDETG